MSKESIAATLKALREKYGYTHREVVERLSQLGIEADNPSLSRWENCRNAPTISAFIGLCRIYNISDVHAAFDLQNFDGIEYNLNREGREKLEEYRRLLILSGKYAPIPSESVNKIQTEIQRRTRPLYSLRASAGTGRFLDSDYYEMVEIAPEIPDDATFGIAVAGDSMEPTLQDGQILWVHQQPVIEDGEVGIFFIDGDVFVKEYHVSSDGACLLSHNKKYGPIMLNENNNTRIYGKVIYPKC